MSKNLSKTISYIVFALVGIGLLVYVFKDVDLPSMWNDIIHANYWWIGLALIFAIFAYLIRAARWNLLIESTCNHKPSLWNSFWAEMFGYFANMALPRIGEITRCGALSKTEKLPFDTLIGTVIVERVFDVVMMCLLALITVFLQMERFGSFISNEVITPTIGRLSSISIATIVVIVLILIGVVVFFFFLRKKENIIISKVTSFCRGILDGVKSVYRLEKRGQFIIYTVLLWICYWLMTWFVCFSIPQTAHLGAADGLFLLVVGSIGMAVPVQGGIGAFHYIVALALTIYGLNFNTDGLLYATISHESQLIVEIVLGLLSLYFVFRKTTKNE